MKHVKEKPRSTGSPGLVILSFMAAMMTLGSLGYTPVANAAFWFGLISAFSSKYEDITEQIDFSDVKMNFLAAARLGLHAQFDWFGQRRVPAQTLICDRLLPEAQAGLERSGIAPGDIKRYLGIIEE